MLSRNYSKCTKRFLFQLWHFLDLLLALLCVISTKAVDHNANDLRLLDAYHSVTGIYDTPEAVFDFATSGTTPLSTPVSTPVSTPFTTPVSAPFKGPDSTPVSFPESAPVSAPSSIPFFVPMVIRFNYTGSVHSYLVPANVSSLNVTLFGAQGGAAYSIGGYGAMISTTIPVDAGQELFIFVGGMGTATSGGFNGGGAPDTKSTEYTRGGGGATDIRINEQSLSNRILVAGGGGAGGYCVTGAGGGGGYLAGQDGTVCISGYPSGKGGTQTGGGAYGDGESTCTVASNGLRGQGGKACTSANYAVGSYGGGGGGGYFGGGGSFAAGAGGGSSYSAYPVVSNKTAVNRGDGYALIEFFSAASVPIVNKTASPTAEPSAHPTEVPSLVPSLRPSVVPTYVHTISPTRAGHQVYISGVQLLNGISWGQFESEPAATPAWIASVSHVCAGARASLLRTIILFKRDATDNKRRLNDGFTLASAQSLSSLGVRVFFNITYTQEDFGPFSAESVNSTVGLFTSNFLVNTRNGTFASLLRSELANRGAAEPFITAVSPADPKFQSKEWIDRTGLIPTARPTARPTIIPTRMPTFNDRAPLITEQTLNVSASAIALNVAFLPIAVYPGTLYCAALLASADKLTSTSQVTAAGFKASYLIGATAAQVKITGLSALTPYVTYCYLETSRGIGNSLLEVQDTRRTSTTTCCKALTFHNAPATVFGDPSRYAFSQSSQYVFTYSLGSAPSDSLTVTPEFRSSGGQLMDPSVITTSPTSASFTAQSTALTSSFVITTGATFVSGNYVLTLKLSGNSVIQYRSISTNVRVLSASSPPDPPVLQSAIFSADGSAITVTFDSATNQVATTVTGCATLFVFDGNNKASCRWISNAQVRVTFIAYDGTTTYAEPQSLFGLRGGVIKAICASGAVCTDYVASAAQNVTISAPNNALTPGVIVAVPASVTSCANITIDASQSTGHGGRPWRSVIWSVRASVSGVDTTELQTQLNSLGTRISQFFTFPAVLYAQPGVEYTLSLSVTNFLGASNSASALFSLFGNPNFPTVQILGGTSFTINPSSTLTIYSSSSKAACAEKQVTFSTRWRVYTMDLTLVSSAVTTSRDPSILILPPLTLAAGTRYRAQVTTTVSASSTNPLVSATAEALVTVQSGQIIALVTGGDSRLVPATEVVNVDASNSYDENLGRDALSVGLSFQWSCSYLTASQFGTSCDSVFVSGTTSQASVSIQGLLLDSTQVYSFTVQVTSADGRTASKSVTLQVQAPESSTNLIIGNLPRKVNANTRLALTVQLVAGYALTGTWSASIDGSAVDLSADTPLTESFTALDVQTPGIAFPLLVSNNAHSAGSEVTFRFTATRTGTSFTSLYASFAEASVVINAPPLSGVFTVTPSSGSALSTVFRFLASGYTDDASDLPLSYMFSYAANQESTALVVQPLSGVNSASVLLPAGSESLDYFIDSLTTVYDIFGASTTATSPVRVTSVSSASAVSTYLNESLEAFAATGDTSFAFNLVNNVATTLSTVNCSIATAVFCTSRNRGPCATEPNTCSSCLDGYSGISGNSNAKCLLNTEGRRLSEQNLYGNPCNTDDECLLGNCTSNVCVVPPLLCPTSVIGSVCSGNGQCAYTDTTGKALALCTVIDTQCFATCACVTGWGGYDCSLTSEELLQRDASRRSLCSTILAVAGQSNPSVVLLDNLVGSLSTLFLPAEVVSNATLSTCTAALTTIATLAADGYFINGAPDTILNLLDLTGRFARAGNTSETYNTTSLTDALTQISTGVLLSMVNGQADKSVASVNIKFTASKSLVRQFSGLIAPTSEQEDEYGVDSKALLELADSAFAAACDAGNGYVDVSLTQWGAVPYDGASQLIAPQIQFESKVPATASRHMLPSNEQQAQLSESTPSYYVVFQFNQPQGLLPVPEENATFPECTVYDPQTHKYVPCNGCEVSFYTNTNVTYACYDINQLCTSGSTVRRLEESLDSGRKLVSYDDYIDDASSFGAQTSVTTIQYSALISTFSRVLSANVFAMNFAAAKVTLSVVLVLVGIIILGFIYFRAWDVRDHNMFLYKFKEPPHLRVKKKYQSKKLSFKKSSQNLMSTMVYGSPASEKKSKELNNKSENFDFGAELGIEYTLVYPEDGKETDQGGQVSPNSQKNSVPADTASLSEGPGTNYSDSSMRTPTARPDPFAKSDTMKNCAFNPTSKNFDVHDDELLVRNAVENYIHNVIPIKNLAGAPTTTLSTLLGLIAQHPLSNLFFSPSLQITRVQRWMMVCLDIMCGLFVDTLFFSTFYPNAGECENYITVMDCESPQNSALNSNLCVWKEDLTTVNGGDCEAVPPPSDIMFVMVLVMITMVVTVPLVFVFDFVMTQYCSKRPNFALWGYNTEAVLGASTQKLGEFNTEKISAPIVSLRRQIKRVRQLDGAALRFHSPAYRSYAPEATTKVEDNVNDSENEEARAVYEEFIGVKEEVEAVLQDAITYLTVTLRNQNVPWKTSEASGHTAATAVLLNQDKIKAIEDQLGVYADGTPAQLTLLERILYGTAKGKLRTKLQSARRKAAQIREMMENLGETELLSKDQALTQFFVLEQFSIFKQYALRSQLFSFAVTTALPVDPGVWVAAWAFLIGGLMFFVYWTLAWGVSTSDVTVKAWGINFAIATAQEVFIVQVFRLYIIYMISNIFIKPQLTAIYRTLQRLAIEYVQDELPDAFGVIKVVQHISPACRVASMKVSDNLAAGQILRHIDDHDIRNFRYASEVGLPILFLSVVAIPVIIGLASDAAGDIALDTVLPSVFSMLVVGHYLLYQISPVAVILPYSFLIFILLTHSYVSTEAEKRLFQIRHCRAAQKDSKTLAGWHVRSNKVFDAAESYPASVMRYFKCMAQRYVSCTVDMLAVVTYYATHWTELKKLIYQAMFPVPVRKTQIAQWKCLNMPQYLQGEIIDMCVAEEMDKTAKMALSLPVIPGRVLAMSVHVSAHWDRVEAAMHQKTCGDSLLKKLCSECDQLEPAALPADQSNATFGSVIRDGTHAHAVIGGEAGQRFKEKYGFCESARDAIVKVMASYQIQKMDGSLYFLSLLDETLLMSADSPTKLLQYEGHVHVRDAALMLEEILYFYHPNGRALTDAELKHVLFAYDRWVATNTLPLEREVLNAVNFLLARPATEIQQAKNANDHRGNDTIDRGYFQQHKLVSLMHFGRIAKDMKMQSPGATIHAADPATASQPYSPEGRTSSTWSDIRRLLDTEYEKLISVENSLMGAALRSLSGQQKLSIAARLESKKYRTEKEPEKVSIAQATVAFHLFVRFLESALQDAVQENKVEEGPQN